MRVLLVDDSPEDRVLALREIRGEFPDVEVTEAGTPPELAAALAEPPFDVVVTDYQLQWANGLEVLAAVKARAPECPVVMFTGTGSEEIAVSALKGGLSDYVLKTHARRLGPAVSVVLDLCRQQAAAAEADAARRRAAEELGRRNAALERLARRLETLSTRLIDAQETERRLLAKELHDEIGQALTAVKLSLHAARLSTDRRGSEAALDAAASVADRALEQVRGMSLALRPAILDDLGLEPAARWLVTTQAQLGGLEATVDVDLAGPRLARELETTCFRVLQEATGNAVRHAGATRLHVRLARDGETLHLSVIDDGRGFDVDEALARAGRGESLGLLSMQERASMAGGQLEIFSSAAGTNVRGRWPVTVGAPRPEA